MKPKTKILSTWIIIASIILTGLINYNIETFDENISVKCVRKYRPFHEHKGQTYYGDGYKMIINHTKYGYADISVGVDTYESVNVGKTITFVWSQSELAKHFSNYPERVWYLRSEVLMVGSFILIIIGFIITGLYTDWN
jgi:hypothetical protein